MNFVNILSEKDFPKEYVWDSSLKVIFVLNGDLSFHIGSSEIHLNNHDIAFIKPYELYGGATSENSNVYVLEIFSDIWKIICPEIDKLDLSLRILKSTDKYSAYKKICRSLSQILYYNSSTEVHSKARLYTAISEIVAILIEDFSSGISYESISDQDNTRIRNIMNYIRDNYDQKISLQMIADEIGFHPQYFSSYFKKQFGTNFTDYLNNYRISRSTKLLTESNESIINIALSCGFNNHKTFSNAFEKIFHCSPREYRKNADISDYSAVNDYESETFDYLKRFWDKEADIPSPLETAHKYCNIFIREGRASMLNSSHNMISIGRAISCLRSDLQIQLRKAKTDFNLEYARIRDIFSDDLFVYYEDSSKKPTFSWRNLDQVLDFLLSIGLKPFIEIGYMPEQLASKKQYAGWQYHPNVSFPKSLDQWSYLVESFISHLYSRFGRSTVNSWIFDHWTSPNLNMKNGYWNEGMEQFFIFYKATFHAIKKIAPDLKVGTPNFSYPSGFHYYDDFFKFARKNNITPDFFSTHLYGCGDGLDIDNSFAHYNSFESSYTLPDAKPDRNMLPQALNTIKEILRRNSRSAMPVIVDDWNVTFFPTDYTRDTCFMAPYIIENYFKTFDKAYGMGFASLSDIHEDFFNSDHLFGGGPGLLTYNGIAKASYSALKMAYSFSRNICQIGENYVVGKTDNGYEILIYNTDFYSDDYIKNLSSVISFTQRYHVFETVPDISCHIEVPVEGENYRITKTTISRQHGSSYDTWISMGSPSPMTPEMSEYLKQVSVPSVSYHTVNVFEKLKLDVIVEPHSVMHIDIQKL